MSPALPFNSVTPFVQSIVDPNVLALSSGKRLAPMRAEVFQAAADDPKILAREIIMSFLQRTQLIKRFGPPPDLAVDSKVRETIDSWNLGIPPDILEMRIQCGVAVGALGYRHASFELQVAVALFCFIVACFDDGLIGEKARREFLPRYYLNQPQLHVVPERMIETALALRKFVPLYSGNIILSALLQYANEDVFYMDESVVLTQDLQPEAREYVEFVRLNDGIPGPFIVCIWPTSICPDVKEYIQALPPAFDWCNIVNDMFSFYKEMLAGDRGNYVHRYASVHGKTIRETLQDIVERLIRSDENVRAILGEGKARDAWDSFTAGFAQFHIYAPRYKLHEVIPELF
ncbi:unnamed protein product [Somion occarium]|uniref:Uncharacterized protein n=1 Tax=Somion occarium TaxID=3059160 RepID=A0ABP1EAA4_9APHY